MSDFLRRFWRSRNGHQRKMISIIAVSFLILVFGGLILFFTKNSASKEAGAVELTCHDSDGENTRTKGAVTYTDVKGKHVDEDSCDLSEKALYEMTCHKTSFFSFSSVPEKKTVVCPKGCINGMCTK